MPKPPTRSDPPDAAPGHRPEARPPASAAKPAALVTGANRGLGHETARQLAAAGHPVWLSARDPAAARRAAAALPGARPLTLDVADADSVRRAADTVRTRGPAPGILVNNAAIDYDTDQSALDADLHRVRRTLETNLLGVWTVCRSFAPLLGEHEHSVIVNVSSGGGALAAGHGAPGYCVSKAAVNRLTRLFAAELQPQGTLVNAVCPGWVATDMGGGGRPVAEGARGIVWAATLAPGGPTDGFFRDAAAIPW